MRSKWPVQLFKLLGIGCMAEGTNAAPGLSFSLRGSYWHKTDIGFAEAQLVLDWARLHVTKLPHRVLILVNLPQWLISRCRYLVEMANASLFYTINCNRFPVCLNVTVKVVKYRTNRTPPTDMELE
jgi:hypothetical protein